MQKCASWKVWLALLGIVPQIALAAEPAAKESAFGVYQGYSPVLYPDQIKTSFYLPIRDGVRLAVDLYRPGVGNHPADGRFPVIWHQHVRSKICIPVGR